MPCRRRCSQTPPGRFAHVSGPLCRGGRERNAAGLCFQDHRRRPDPPLFHILGRGWKWGSGRLRHGHRGGCERQRPGGRPHLVERLPNHGQCIPFLPEPGRPRFSFSTDSNYGEISGRIGNSPGLHSLFNSTPQGTYSPFRPVASRIGPPVMLASISAKFGITSFSPLKRACQQHLYCSQHNLPPQGPECHWHSMLLPSTRASCSVTCGNQGRPYRPRPGRVKR